MLRSATRGVRHPNAAVALVRFNHADPGEAARRVLRERASVRSFAKEPVPDAVLADILRIVQVRVAIALGFNAQWWTHGAPLQMRTIESTDGV
jgi:hypothetical protein